MADQATIDDVSAGAQPTNPQPQNQGGGIGPQDNKIIIGQFFPAGGREDNIIDHIRIDGGPMLDYNSPESSWKVKEGSLVEVFGRGLGIYNQAALWVRGRDREPIDADNLKRKAGEEGLEFRAKFTKDLYEDGSEVELEFLQSNRPDNDRSLSRKLYYSFKTETEDEGQKKAKAGQGGEGLAQKQARPASVPTTGPTAASQPGSMTNTLAAAKAAAAAAAQEPDDSEETTGGEAIASAALPQTLKQSTEIIGEHLDKNPELITDATVRTEVMQGLRSGNLANLSSQAQTALRTSVAGSITSQTGAQAEQLRAASQIINRQVSSQAEVRAQTQVSSSVEASASSQSRQEIAGQAREQARSSAQARVSGGLSASQAGAGQALAQGTASGQIRAEAQSQARAGQTKSIRLEGQAEVPAPAGGPSQGRLGLKQNLGIVGEHLYKNPELIPNSKNRGEILSALSAGDVSPLGDESQTELQQTLKKLGGGQSPASPEVAAAANQALEQTAEMAAPVQAQPAGISQPPPSPKEPKPKGQTAAKPPAGMSKLLGKFSDNDAAIGGKLNPSNQAKDKFSPAGSPGESSSLPPGSPSEPTEEPASGDDSEMAPGAPAQRPRGSMDSAMPPQLGNRQADNGPESPEDNKDADKENDEPDKPEDEEEEESEEEDAEPNTPPVPPVPAAAAGPEAGLAAGAANKALAEGGEKLLKEFAPELWLGAKFGQILWKYKWYIAGAITIFFLFLFSVVMIAGCKYPIPYNVVTGYNGTAIGHYIGDGCKSFDISNFSSAPSGAGGAGGTGTAAGK